MNINPIHLIDGYKINHVFQYPENTTLVYSNFTPRWSRDGDIDGVVVFGLQYFIQEYLIRRFNQDFFKTPIDIVMRQYTRRINMYCGMEIKNDHIKALHNLGYLPLRIKALPEGTVCPLGTPMLTIYNTEPEQYWLVNYLETLMSSILWGPMTSATTAYKLRKYLNKQAKDTGGDPGFVAFQAHDFSMRGMFGLEGAILSGAGHLLSFNGSDCIPAIDFLEEYYPLDDDQIIGMGVPATEHSVMCAGGEDDELSTFKRLLTEVHPNGLLSVVSDSWDYWNVIDSFLPELKEEIMARDGKLVIRPDSGDPVDICLKTIPKLWDIFGGTTNARGFKELDSHIGLIYGEAINFERMQAIVGGLKNLGFASTNVVFGIGSYTYQHKTRDEHGFAMKATYCEINGEGRSIFKKPKTDDGKKNSHKGLLRVNKDLSVTQEVSWAQEKEGALENVFNNGKLLRKHSLTDIRARLWSD